MLGPGSQRQNRTSFLKLSQQRRKDLSFQASDPENLKKGLPPTPHVPP